MGLISTPDTIFDWDGIGYYAANGARLERSEGERDICADCGGYYPRNLDMPLHKALCAGLEGIDACDHSGGAVESETALVILCADCGLPRDESALWARFVERRESAGATCAELPQYWHRSDCGRKARCQSCGLGGFRDCQLYGGRYCDNCEFLRRSGVNARSSTGGDWWDERG